MLLAGVPLAMTLHSLARTQQLACVGIVQVRVYTSA